MRLTSAVAIVLCLAGHDVSAQVEQERAATTARVVRGVVVRATDDAPLARARVTVTRDGRPIASVLTDARGEFSLTVPPEPALSLRVSKAGYAVTTLPIGAGRGDVPTELRVAMAKGAVIAGRAIDENGAPLRRRDRRQRCRPRQRRRGSADDDDVDA